MTNLDLMVYRLAYHMAMADGELSSNEATILDVLARSLGLDENEVESLKTEADRIDYDRLHQLFPEREHQLMLFEVACLLAMADGRSQLEEWQLAVRLSQALRIDKPDADQCLAQARARLRVLARDHDLAPEIRANLAKQGLIE